MKAPLTIKPMDEVKTIGQIFGARRIIKGKTWLPLVELVTWGIMAWYAGRQHPWRSMRQRVSVAALTTAVIIGSEWCHNFAHAAIANFIGKPMDAMRIICGMPRVMYYNIQDEIVTPRQHILRASGGPALNALLFIAAGLLRFWTRSDSTTRDVANVAVGTNAFLSTVSLLPIPGIDGGPILKWYLVETGRNPEEADKIVQKVNGGLGILLGLGAVAFYRRGRRILGFFLAQFAVLALGVGIGVIKEQ